MDHPTKAVPGPVVNWTNGEMLELAARAVGKVVRDDLRGITLLSVDEIAAMSGTLIALGLIAILPGEATPARLLTFAPPET